MRWSALGIVAVLLLAPIGACAADDADIIEKLVSGSPWKGVQFGGGTGRVLTVEMVFTKQGDKLVGVIEKISNPYARGDGPVKSLTLMNGILEFDTSTGLSSYKLKYSDDGKLVGAGISGSKRDRAELTLTPTR
jgi:hypothetical protein